MEKVKNEKSQSPPAQISLDISTNTAENSSSTIYFLTNRKMSVAVDPSPELNPLCVFPPEINLLIFHNFTGAELLKISEVSPDFYNTIADSSHCMKKIKISLNKDDDSITQVIESGRKYQNLEVAQFSKLLEPAKEIMKNSERATNVTVRCIDFKTIWDTVQFFSTFSTTVEELRMNQVYINLFARAGLTTNDLRFPKLKVLETKCCQAVMYHELFTEVKTLNTFIIKSGSHISSLARDAIKTILRSNAGIKILGIHFNVFNLLFSEDIAKIVKFKLKEFHANDLYRVPSTYSNMTDNFEKFLRVQMETLEEVTIGDWMGIEIIKMVLHMPRLKKLTMKGFHHAAHDIDWKNLELRKNTEIMDFYFNDMSNNWKILVKLICALPNLKTLKLYSMDQISMMFLSVTCPGLKSLEVEHFRAINITNEKLFRNLEKFSCRKMEDCVFKNSPPLTYFEKLIFK